MGCCGHEYFMLGHFVMGHIMRCTEEMPVDKMPVKIAREDKMLAILQDRDNNKPILSKHLIDYKPKKPIAEKSLCKNRQ